MAETNQVLVGRQPVLDRNLHIFGYELLFRPTGASGVVDGATATSEVIANTLFSIGFDQLVGPHAAFINFDRELLLSDRPGLLPPRRTVIEVLETVTVDQALIDACRDFQKLGYLIAIDDYVGDPGFDPLIPVADIIKIDVRAAGIADQQRMVDRFRGQKLRLLAEKVETPEEFQTCLTMGFHLFQGYFFAHPVTIARREIPANKMTALRVLREANRQDIDAARLETALRQDPALCYKLLRYINSAAFGFSRQIESIRSALVLIGDTRIRQWVSLAVMRSLAHNKPPELVNQVLTRARFSETLSERRGFGGRTGEFFLMGMFSLFDALTDRPLKEILAEVHLNEEPRAALLEPDVVSPFSQIYSLVRAYELSDWDTVAAVSAELELTTDTVCACYVESLGWASSVLNI